jgi:hypothetical protein
MAEVRGWCASLGSVGWTFARIAASVPCSEDSLRDYRDGKAAMPVDKWKALRALAAEVAGRRAAGT